MKLLRFTVVLLSCATLWGYPQHTTPPSAGGQSTPPQAGQPQNPPSLSGQQTIGQQQPATQPAVSRPTPDEMKAFQTVRSELDPDRTIQLVQDFAKKYPDSLLLTSAYLFGANAYQQKGQIDKAIAWGEKSLQLNPNNLASLIMVANMLPQPQAMNGSDVDKDKRLAEAEADANKALQLVPQVITKQGNQTDEQVQKNRAKVASEAHAALGMIYLERATSSLGSPDPAQLAKAEAEYKQAVAVDNPVPQDYFRLGETYRMESKLDDAVAAFTKASQLSQGMPLQTMADNQVALLKKAKAAQPPAKPH